MKDIVDSFAHLLALRAGDNGTQIFARFNGEPITFGDLHKKSDAMAADLRRRGVNQDDRVAVMMQNSPGTLIVLFALAKAGIVWVPINARQKGEGLRFILEHSDPKLVIADDEFVSVVLAAGVVDVSRLLIHGATDKNGTNLEALYSQDLPFNEPVPAPEAIFGILYTSGTTGRPKGVVTTHRMMALAGQAVAKATEIRAGDVFFMWEPLYHIGGAQLIVLPLLHRVVLSMVSRFSASRFWEQVRACNATHIHYLGGILQLLLKSSPRDIDREHKVRIAWGGGCATEVWDKFQDRFGVEIRECYGMTETSSLTSFNDDGTVGSIGRPVSWFQVDVLRPDGAKAEKDEQGEIVVRTALEGAIFKYYYLDPVASKAALRDGGFHTGDLGSFDSEGRLFFHGRITDSVRCRGENVSAWEVERVAAAHPAILDCAMVGVPAEIGEYDIKLFAVLKPGAEIDLEALSRWLGERLASYQNPRYLAMVSDFERTPSERIIKHTLSRSTNDCWDREVSGAARPHMCAG